MNRSQFPSGGWKFFMPQTGWHAPTPTSSTFDQTVILIIKHRIANPAVTAQYQLATDTFTVGNELESYTRSRLGIPGVPFDPKTSPRPAFPRSVEAAGAAVKSLAAGAAILFSWEESGLPPVSKEQAEKRAATCAACPKNVKGDFSRYFTKPVSEMYRAKLERLHKLALVTSQDDKLQICEACICPLKLKCWCPTALITQHLAPEVRQKLHASCWIPLEEKAG